MAKKKKKSKKKKVSTTGRFGPRYGVRVRRSTKNIEESLRHKYECPKCNHHKVSRESSGIWTCSKCGLTFAGGAYQPQPDKDIRFEEDS